MTCVLGEPCGVPEAAVGLGVTFVLFIHQALLQIPKGARSKL